MERMKTQTTGALTEILLTVPTQEAQRVCALLDSVLAFIEPCASCSNEKGEALFPAREVFPESSPGNRLRGLRAREGITQKELAKVLGVRQHHISEMEKGARSISREMAKRIGEAYAVSYKVFL